MQRTVHSSSGSDSSSNSSSPQKIKNIYWKLKSSIHNHSLRHRHNNSHHRQHTKSHHHHHTSLHYRRSQVLSDPQRDVFENFVAVDSYMCSTLLPSSTSLDAAFKSNAYTSHEVIDITPNKGKMLYLLAKMNHSSRILQIGGRSGHLAIWLAKAAGPEGKVTVFESKHENAKITEANVANSRFEDVVEVKCCPTLEALEQMVPKENAPVFEMVYIDADEDNCVNYLQWVLKFAHVGTLIVVDNVVREGQIVDFENMDPAIQGTRKMLELLEADKRVESTGVQTVGSLGWDGFAMAIVVE